MNRRIILQIKELIDLYLASLEKERNLSLKTVRGYKNDLNFFEKWLTENKITEINIAETLTPTQIRSFWAGRRKGGLCASSMRRGQSALRGLFKYAIRHGLANKNPVDLMDSPKVQRPLPKALSQEDVTMLINSPDSSNLLGKRDKAILELLYGSGLRVSEVSNLLIDDINLESQILVVREGKGGKDRVVPLTPISCQAISLYMNNRFSEKPEWRKETHVFVNHLGTPLTTRSIARLIDKYARRLAMMMNITPHQFRHSFATHLLNNGADIRAVQEMLGHASLSTTQIYTRISKEKLMQTYRNCHPRA